MNISEYEAAMSKAVAYLEQQLAGLQVGRATTGLVDGLNVASEYGVMKLNSLAHVTVMDTSTLKIEPWDKSNAKAMATAIYDADLWVWVDNQGSHILIKIPALTQERRDHIAKQVKAMGEEAKAQVRLVRQDAMNTSKKEFAAKEISEDLHKANEKNVEDITKSFTTKLDTLVKFKVDDILKG